ncbi:MAG: HPr family phosphocarrier protein [Rhodospirillaceae bacterium]|nr:HPr family phosphocarrier protein [Rhodospirillaceae bacterium]
MTDTPALQPADTPEEMPAGGIERQAEICNQRGLHARAAAKFVRVVKSFDAQVSVSHNGMTIGGDSIMGLMVLAATQGSTITIRADGPQADAVMDALGALVARKFDED